MSSRHPKIRLLIADDEISFNTVLKDELVSCGFSATSAFNGSDALKLLKTTEFDVCLMDINMPHLNGIEVLRDIYEEDLPTEVIILTGHGSIPTAIEAIKLGAYDYITKPASIDQLIVLIEKAFEKRNIKKENILLKWKAESEDIKINTNNPVMKEILDTAMRAAKANTPVLIQGESGTGKELLARAIHYISPRAKGPFVAFNAASIPDSIMESELFGYEKGAFTGASGAKPGLFELASTGTVFLDEIGEITPAMQAKLLRAIETGRFYKVGGIKEAEVDIRIVAATNKDLKKEVDAGRFRRDLYFRINAVTLTLPPLRERKEDIPLLINELLSKTSENIIVEENALQLLISYNWPGNIRELQNVIQRALILSAAPTGQTGPTKGTVIKPENLPLDLREGKPRPPADKPDSAQHITLDDVEKEHIKRIIREVRGHKGKAAKILGIDPKTLYRKMKQYELE